MVIVRERWSFVASRDGAFVGGDNGICNRKTNAVTAGFRISGLVSAVEAVK